MDEIDDRYLYDPLSYTGTHKRRVEENQAIAALSSLSSANSASAPTSTKNSSTMLNSFKLLMQEKRKEKKGKNLVQGS